MVSSGFAVGGGILAHSRKAVSELAAAGWALAIEKGCPSLELRGGPVSGADWTEKTGTYVGFTRDLAKHDEAELLAITRKQRAEVRKALTQKFDISIGSAEARSEEHTSELQSLMRISYAVFCLTQTKNPIITAT